MAYNYGNYQQPYYQNVYPTAVNGPYTGQQYSTAMPMNQMYQVQQPMNQQNQNNNSGFVWVQGEAGAKAYPVAAGNSVLLMDSENPVLYMKSTDASGRPLPMETYDLVKRAPVAYQSASSQQAVDMSQYVKMIDLEDKVNELINKALGQ